MSLGQKALDGTVTEKLLVVVWYSLCLQTVYNLPILSGLQRWGDAEDIDCEFHVGHPLLLTSKELALSADDSKSSTDR